MIQAALSGLLDGRDLARDEARGVMDGIMRGDATAAQIGAFLVALRLKGETPDEIAGCAEAMRAHVVRVRPRRKGATDIAERFHCLSPSLFLAVKMKLPGRSFRAIPAGPVTGRSRSWSTCV